MTSKLTTLLKDETGTSAVEYAILLAMIVALLLASVVAAGGVAGMTFGTNADAIQGALD